MESSHDELSGLLNRNLNKDEERDIVNLEYILCLSSIYQLSKNFSSSVSSSITGYLNNVRNLL